MTKKTEYKLDPRNARTHPARNKDAVEKSLRELGAGRSIVVDADGVVIGGNAVYEEAVKLGIPVKEIETSGEELIVVRRLDLKTDDPRRMALALADNKIGDTSEFDFEMTAELLKELDGEIDLAVTGFADFEIEQLMDADWEPPSVQGDPPSKEPEVVICPECGHEFTTG